MSRLRRLPLVLGIFACGVACGAVEALPPEARVLEIPGVERLRVELLADWPHDRSAYTQGLVWDGAHLLESTGLEGRSSLREVDLESGAVLRRVDLEKDLFGEGLALAGDRLFQLTWRAGRALVWSRGEFRRLAEHRYAGEGWGLCHDGRRLVMSDGSERLTFRDPETFEEVGGVSVTAAGRPLRALNELECVDGWVYANVYTTDTIVRIDPISGEVRATVDASGLLRPDERVAAEVLNGIAYNPERGTFLITGKLWPRLFEVTFRAKDGRATP